MGLWQRANGLYEDLGGGWVHRDEGAGRRRIRLSRCDEFSTLLEIRCTRGIWIFAALAASWPPKPQNSERAVSTVFSGESFCGKSGPGQARLAWPAFAAELVAAALGREFDFASLALKPLRLGKETRHPP